MLDPRFCRAAARLSLASVVVLAAGGCSDDDDPAGPEGAELPIQWTFDSGLDGWDSSEQCDGSPDCYPVGNVTQNDGLVVLEGAGDPDLPNASISRGVLLPDGSATIAIRAISACTGTSADDTDIRIRIQVGGSSTVVQDWTEVAGSWETVSAAVAAFAGQQVTIHVEQNDNGEQEDGAGDAEALCIDDVTISDAV